VVLVVASDWLQPAEPGPSNDSLGRNLTLAGQRDSSPVQGATLSSLGYVAVTRARSLLWLSAPAKRLLAC
jgi:hypothetical protein